MGNFHNSWATCDTHYRACNSAYHELTAELANTQYGLIALVLLTGIACGLAFYYWYHAHKQYKKQRG